MTVIMLLILSLGVPAQNWKCAGSQGLRVELANLVLDQPWMNINHTVERSFLFLAACPAEFLGEMKRDPTIFPAWAKAVTVYASEGKNRQRRQLLWAAVNLAQTRLPEHSEVSTRVLAVLRNVAPANSDVMPGKEDARQVLFRRAIADMAADWPHADGEFTRWLSDDFLFAVAVNPGEFANVMRQSPMVFESWMKRLDSLSFTGLSEDRSESEQFRLCLVQALAKQLPSKLLARVRDRLQQVSFKSIQ